MSSQRQHPGLMAAAALLVASFAAGAEPVSAALAHCAAMTGAEARLACFDQLAGRSADTAASGAPAQGTMPPVQAPPAAVAPLAPATVATPVTAAAPVAGAAAAPDPAEAAESFGLSSAQRHTPVQGPQNIEAHVAQVSTDRSLRSYVVLDNGQTWASTDGGLQLDSGELVTIKHAALGSFMLVSSTSKHSYHVRRVR